MSVQVVSRQNRGEGVGEKGGPGERRRGVGGRALEREGMEGAGARRC